MTELLTDLSDWLSLNPQWIAITLALTAFVESLALVGVIVPGVAILYAIAAVAGALGAPLPLCLAAMMAGAVCGDLFSFLLGRHAHQPLLQRWPFRQHPQWIERGESFFHRRGNFSVVIGRFIGPLRPMIPFVAGMLQMPPRRFVLLNLASAPVWAAVYLLPGYLLGHLGANAGQLGALADNTAISPKHLHLGLLSAATVLLCVITLLLLQRWLTPKRPIYRQLCLRLRLSSRRSGLTAHMTEPNNARHPDHTAAPLAAVLLLLGSGSLLLLLILSVILGHPLQSLDQTLSLLLQLIRSEALDRLMINITMFGDGLHLALLSLPLFALLWWQAQRQPKVAAQRLLHWAGALLLVMLLTQLLKFGFAIDRPTLLIQPLNSFSFPSGHSANSSLFFTLLAFLLAQQYPHRYRWMLYAIAALPVLLVGVSRIYLGVHWFSDVLAGWLLGLTVCAAAQVSLAYRQPLSAELRPPQLGVARLLTSVAAVLISAIYLISRIDGAVIRYLPL
ncbi:MAG: bifunctional DedA family/phosphatase PAP2 family protein [Motiliproteus sp.]